MTVFVSDEVLENRTLATEQPETFRLARTDFISCENLDCENRYEIFAKNVGFVWWYCGECKSYDEGE